MNTEQFKINKLEIENFRGFESITTEFDENLTVIIGNNGSGKTSILDCIAKFLIYFEQRFTQKGFDVEKIPFSKYDINNKATSRKTTNRLSFSLNRESLSIVMGYEKQPAIEQFGSDEEMVFFETIVNEIGEEYINNTIQSIPIMAYYSGQSLTFYINKEILEKQDDNSIFKTYDDALADQKFDFTHFFKWFEKEQKMSMQRGDTKILHTIRTSIEMMLNDENKYENLQVEWGYPDEMVIYKNEERLIINQLSSGEKNLIAMVADLAFRLNVANPKSENPLEGNGVVLIDEIDLHLHPRWQRKVLTKLREIFPNVQFVVTTHSPQVISEVLDGKVYQLNNSEVYDIHSYGKEINLINAEMGDRIRPAKAQKQIDEIFGLINDNKFEEANEKINYLEKIIKNDSIFVAARNLIIRKKLIGR